MPNISQLIDNRELLDFSQNLSPVRPYTGAGLFPDRKTQYIEQEYTRLCRNGNLPAASDQGEDQPHRDRASSHARPLHERGQPARVRLR